MAVVAGDEVFGARQRHHALTDGPQDRITRSAPKRVVEFPEMIDVDHHHGECMAVALGAHFLAVQRFLQEATVIHAGH